MRRGTAVLPLRTSRGTKATACEHNHHYQRGSNTYIAVVIHILRIPSDRDSASTRDARVDGVQAASERIDDCKVICQSFIRAWLEGRCVAASIRREGVNGAKERVRIEP